ncbi:hypothetical protein [Streptomyces sp. NPDC089919]|uniref:hypothetical protein n=1 Tax=Streptomyces sp. NPDC089919 TaxID=3155188 RepID=UPI00341DFA5B
MSAGFDLAAAAVDAIARGGAARGADERAAVELLRDRLDGVPEGPEAVAAVERVPEDVQARLRLRDAAAAVLAGDPAFAAHLAELLAPPEAPAPPRPVPVPELPPGTGRTGRDRTRAGGDRTGPRRGSGTAAAAALARRAAARVRAREPVALLSLTAVVLVLALAGYGLSGVLGGGGDGADGPRRVVALKDPEKVKDIAPGLPAMPPGWTTMSAPEVKECEPKKEDCSGVLHQSWSYFKDPNEQMVTFEVTACASTDDARRVYRRLVTKEEDGDSDHLSLPSLGDQSAGFEDRDEGDDEGSTFVRVGTVVISVWAANVQGPYEPATLRTLTRMIAARAQEAQNGQPPSARAA